MNRGPWASGVHIRQTMSGHVTILNITVILKVNHAKY